MNHNVIAELKVIPLGTSSPGLSEYVKAVVAIVKKTPGIKYQVTPMATIIEGPLAKVLELAKQVHELPFQMGAQRVLTSLSIDDRRDKPITMESKVKAVS
ncbi:MAG: MTH1187 family thiamine-binding protein [Dehalococcoidales bacterium]|nr:MTH1187 family thiamine-binding protein [Dehalococcoidales bacterium]